MLKEKGGSAKIKHAIFHIAPAPPPLSINNDRSLIEQKCGETNTTDQFCHLKNHTVEPPLNGHHLLSSQ